MTVYDWLILAFWLMFIAYWAISAPGAKRVQSAGGDGGGRAACD